MKTVHGALIRFRKGAGISRGKLLRNRVVALCGVPIVAALRCAQDSFRAACPGSFSALLGCVRHQILQHFCDSRLQSWAQEFAALVAIGGVGLSENFNLRIR